MKIRVSYILKFIAILFFCVGMFFLWRGYPIKPTNYDQKELYESNIYGYLMTDGKKTKAWVTAVDIERNNIVNIRVKFFTDRGSIAESKINNIKIMLTVGEFVDILYNAKKPQQAMIHPADERTLGWQNFGWCFIMGFLLYLIGHVRYKKSNGLE